MKEGWQVKKLGDICDLQNGYAFKSGDYIESSNTLNIRMSSIRPDGSFDSEHNQRFLPDTFAKAYESFLLKEDDLIIAMTDMAGDPKILGVPTLVANLNGRSFLMNQRVGKLFKFSESIQIPYLRYFLSSPSTKEFYKNKGAGGLQINISKGDVLSVDVPLPPLPEQQRIVAILDDAFESIAIAKANAEKNLQNARALFESYLQGIFSQGGEGWSIKILGDTSILKIIDGDRGSNYPNKEDFSDDGFCLFLNTKNVRPDGFNFDKTMFVSEEKDKSLRKGKLQRQDVILTTRGTIGNVAIFDESVEFENIRINSGMLIFRVNPEELLPSFLYEVFRSGIMKEQMTRYVSGAAQPQLPIKTLINFEIPIPNSLAAQGKIVDGVRAINHETQRLESIYQQKITALDELKKALLHQAFSGQL